MIAFNMTVTLFTWKYNEAQSVGVKCLSLYCFIEVILESTDYNNVQKNRDTCMATCNCITHTHHYASNIADDVLTNHNEISDSWFLKSVMWKLINDYSTCNNAYAWYA